MARNHMAVQRQEKDYNAASESLVVKNALYQPNQQPSEEDEDLDFSINDVTKSCDAKMTEQCQADAENVAFSHDESSLKGNDVKTDSDNGMVRRVKTFASKYMPWSTLLKMAPECFIGTQDTEVSFQDMKKVESVNSRIKQKQITSFTVANVYKGDDTANSSYQIEKLVSNISPSSFSKEIQYANEENYNPNPEIGDKELTHGNDQYLRSASNVEDKTKTCDVNMVCKGENDKSYKIDEKAVDPAKTKVENFNKLIDKPVDKECTESNLQSIKRSPMAKISPYAQKVPSDMNSYSQQMSRTQNTDSLVPEQLTSDEVDVIIVFSNGGTLRLAVKKKERIGPVALKLQQLVFLMGWESPYKTFTLTLITDAGQYFLGQHVKIHNLINTSTGVVKLHATFCVIRDVVPTGLRYTVMIHRWFVKLGRTQLLTYSHGFERMPD